jgi:hypothetical protein
MTADPVMIREGKIAALEAEVHAIDRSNASYWRQGSTADVAARAEYQRRLERLEEIRRELAQLRSAE